MKATFCFSIILFVLFGCGNDQNNASQEVINTLDTATTHCYIYSQAGYEELIQIKIKDNKITGQGNYIEQGLQMSYTSTIAGELKNGEAQVLVTATARRGNNSLTSNQIWSFGAEGVTTASSKILGEEKSITYRKINCPSSSSVGDTSLYDYFGAFFEGYAVVGRYGRYGLINEQGNITIPIKYASLGLVNEGSIEYYDDGLGRSGLLDVNGEVLIEPKYEEIHCYNEGLAAFLNESGLWGFLDREQNVVIEPIFTEINVFQPEPNRHPFNEGLANVKLANNYWNYINTKGEVVIAGDYSFAKAFRNGQAEVHKNARIFYIDTDGNCVRNCD